MTETLKKLLDSIGGEAAAVRHRKSLEALDAEESDARAERSRLVAEIEERAAGGADTAGLAGQIAAVDAKLQTFSLRRAPLSRLVAEAEASAEAKRDADERLRLAKKLEAKRERAAQLRIAAVGAFSDGLAALAQLESIGAPAARLGAKLGTFGLDTDSTPEAIARDAMALFRDTAPKTVSFDELEPGLTAVTLIMPRVRQGNDD